ncbi:hypothetical protein C8R43DRAFT_621544 [Mycena crocata]|nr:hypothetical protein C8R43DRAFT_621544 [Mycena crocata]
MPQSLPEFFIVQRRRAQIACSNCRRRKIKCVPVDDAERPDAPCQRCSKRGFNCEYLAVSEQDNASSSSNSFGPAIPPTRTEPSHNAITPIPVNTNTHPTRRREQRGDHISAMTHPSMSRIAHAGLPEDNRNSAQYTSFAPHPAHTHRLYTPETTPYYAPAPFIGGSTAHHLDYGQYGNVAASWQPESTAAVPAWHRHPTHSPACNFPLGPCYCESDLRQ